MFLRMTSTSGNSSQEILMSRRIYVYKINDVKQQIDKINSDRRGVNLITWIPGTKVKETWYMCPCEQKNDTPKAYCDGIISITVNPEEHEIINISLISIHDEQMTYIRHENGYRDMAEKLSLSCQPVTIFI